MSPRLMIGARRERKEDTILPISVPPEVDHNNSVSIIIPNIRLFQRLAYLSVTAYLTVLYASAVPFVLCVENSFSHHTLLFCHFHSWSSVHNCKGKDKIG